ncbi:MAG: hypothetical protein U1D96_09655 [Eubacteriales bacterium]|jgi:hypothetical protein|nr:hypothetical protein [Bacillota bacterium]MBV1727608.1 hypothetical protein [Desulforudis sp.]MDQ7789544.1 hypothetical protein [Clostridia bacterium]MDZ4043730.1 hypothetical protein [Eubacteriales bacterium]MBU4532853.1 hypothetical protein [Bacillota bacterium]
MIVIFISALKRKMLFGFRLFLLIIILTILVTQIYAVFRPEPPDAKPTMTQIESDSGIIDGLTERLKEYYRGNSR